MGNKLLSGIAALTLAACAAPGPEALFKNETSVELVRRAESLERLGLYPEARLTYEAAAATGAPVTDKLSALNARAERRASEAFDAGEAQRKRGEISAARASYLLALSIDPTRMDAFEQLRVLERRRTVASFAAPPPVPVAMDNEPEAEPSIEEFKKSFGDYFNRVRSVLEQGAEAPQGD